MIRYQFQIIYYIIFCFVNTIIQCQTKELNTVCAEDNKYTKADEIYRLNLEEVTKFNMQAAGKSKYYCKYNDSINVPVCYLNDKNNNMNNEIKNNREVSKKVRLNNISRTIMIKKESSVAGDTLLSVAVVAVSLLLVWVFSWQF